MAKLPGPHLRSKAGTRRTTTLARCAGALLTSLLVASSLVAQEGPPSSKNGTNDAPPTRSAEAQSVPSVPTGWRIYRDPATGELLSTPLPGQAESLTAKWERRRPGRRPDLALRSFPVVLNGRTIGLGVKLDDRFVTSTVLIRHADGTETLACIDSTEPLKAPPPPAIAER